MEKKKCPWSLQQGLAGSWFSAFPGIWFNHLASFYELKTIHAIYSYIPMWINMSYTKLVHLSTIIELHLNERRNSCGKNALHLQFFTMKDLKFRANWLVLKPLKCPPLRACRSQGVLRVRANIAASSLNHSPEIWPKSKTNGFGSWIMVQLPSNFQPPIFYTKRAAFWNQVFQVVQMFFSGCAVCVSQKKISSFWSKCHTWTQGKKHTTCSFFRGRYFAVSPPKKNTRMGHFIFKSHRQITFFAWPF